MTPARGNMGWSNDDIAAFIEAEQLPASFHDTIVQIYAPITQLVSDRHEALQRPILVGLCGPQGSGKSTAVASLRRLLQADGLRVAVLSLDDLYLTRAERAELGARVHPLLATRGPPGTHDLGLGEATIDGLLAGRNVVLPAFDKALDDRIVQTDWQTFDGPADVVLFEGWCVGARPQDNDELARPLNALERDLDPDGIWRRFVNDALMAYQPLFARTDLLIQLRPPDFTAVIGWRCEQEAKLRARSDSRPGLSVMTDAEVRRFVQHYERLTLAILREMPARADLVVDLGPQRQLRRLTYRSLA